MKLHVTNLPKTPEFPHSTAVMVTGLCRGRARHHTAVELEDGGVKRTVVEEIPRLCACGCGTTPVLTPTQPTAYLLMVRSLTSKPQVQHLHLHIAMAEQPPGALSAAFPPPPKYFTSFTPENLNALKELRRPDGTHPPADELPEELQVLVPPPPPEKRYRAFGDPWTLPEIYPSLEDAGIQQLYPSTSSGSQNGKEKESSLDRTLELRRLSKSLLLNYLELVGVMGIAPEQVCSTSPTRRREGGNN